MIDIKIQLIREMLRIRTIEELIAYSYHEQEMRCPTHFSIGQEGTAVGVCKNLNKDDRIVSTHRSHAHYLAKGGDLKSMLCELYGKAEGCSSGKGGSMHLVDTNAGFVGSTSIVSGTIPVGVGVAFAQKMKRKNGITVVFFGDGATEEGLFYESVNYAALHRLPVLFLCENNLYSVYTHLSERQPEERKIYKVAEAMGIESELVEENDVLKVYSSVKKAKEYILSQKKPYFIEVNTYRWLEHCGPNYDNNLGYRTEKEFLFHKEQDALLKLQREMEEHGLITEAQMQDWIKEYKEEIDELLKYAKKAPWPQSSTLYKDVYAD